MSTYSWTTFYRLRTYSESCTFENNTAHTNHYNFLYTDVLGRAHEGYGRGGGVYVLLKSGAGLAVKTLGGDKRKTERIRIKVANGLHIRTKWLKW